MNTSRAVTAITIITLGLAAGTAFAADDAFNQNASRSNHTNHLSSGSGAASASYAAAGRTAAAGEDEIVEPTEAAAGVKSPRDAASGQATGKRQHKPVTTSGGDLDGDGADASVQDHNSSRSNKSSSVAADGGASGDGNAPRDAASGLATGKRQHKPVASPDLDSDNDGVSDAAAQDMPGSYKAKQGKTGSAK